jgi:O-methyltransferase involved in polyketide biosynthesis
MKPREPSRTAWGAARHRAVHQLIEGGRILADPLAVAILGGDTGDPANNALLNDRDNELSGRGIRFLIVARSALAEAKLAEAVAGRGVSQLVVLGAGVVTFAYRSPVAERLRDDHRGRRRGRRVGLARGNPRCGDGAACAAARR